MWKWRRYLEKTHQVRVVELVLHQNLYRKAQIGHLSRQLTRSYFPLLKRSLLFDDDIKGKIESAKYDFKTPPM